MVTDAYSILAKWSNHFSQLFNVHEISAVRHTEIHTAEPLVREPSAFEVEMAFEKLKRNKSPGIDQNTSRNDYSGGRTIRSGSGRSRSLYLFIRMTIK